MNEHFGEILTSLKIETAYKMKGKEKRCTEIQFTDDEICKNTGKWSKFLSKALEKTIGEFLQHLEKENKGSFELISSKTKNEFLVDIIIVEKKDIIKPKIEYTEKKRGSAT